MAVYELLKGSSVVVCMTGVPGDGDGRLISLITTSYRRMLKMDGQCRGALNRSLLQFSHSRFRFSHVQVL